MHDQLSMRAMHEDGDVILEALQCAAKLDKRLGVS